jgi:DNA-binding transcriptional MocR family regulator
MAELGVSPGTVRAAVAELVRSGLVETVSGSGTFIAHRVEPVEPAGDRSWQTIALGPNPQDPDLLGSLRAPTTPGVVDLASGYPDATLQATALVARVLRSVARRSTALDRAPSEGMASLRHWFAAELSPGQEHEVLIAPGGQAALSLVFRALGLAGDTVIMESPTYVGAMAAARAAGCVPVPVSVDQDGIVVDDLEAAVHRSGATMVYLQPRYHNPVGSTLTRDRRHHLMALARQHGLIIIEDDWLQDLDDPDSRVAPLAADDPHGHVVHVRSLTKSTVPALRIAGIASSGAIAQRLRTTRGTEDFFVSPILQEAALEVVTSQDWPRHLRRLRSQLVHRQAVLGQELERVADSLRVVGGGPLHLWVQARGGIDAERLRVAALGHGVALVAGNHWFPGDAPTDHLRLSNTATTADQIRVGVDRLELALATLS